MRILDYIPNGAEIGVGLALRLRTGEYVFFLPGARHKNTSNAKELFYAGIGGHLEPGESLIECGRREALEEIGLPIEYEGSSNSFYMDSNKNIRSIDVNEEIKPLAIFEMVHQKDTPKAGKIYHIVIFKAFLELEPSYFQQEELSGIILLNQEQVRLGDRRASIQQLLDEGARIIGADIHRETIVYPIGTAKALTLLGNVIG